MSRDLLDLVRELNTLNDDNLADRVIENSDVQWCLSELQDILEEMSTLTPPNAPLTIEQLREMDGEPVWVVPTGTHKKDEPMWCVLEGSMALIPGVDCWLWDFDGYGETWMAYRRPPGGEDA